MSLWSTLQTRLHPFDHPVPQTWPRCYETKFTLAAWLQPRRILEIGVRTGYSAFAFLQACPQASYLGIDNDSATHGGFPGAGAHARQLLEPYDVTFRLSSSAEFAAECQISLRWPPCDWVHIDGDHSLSGCYHDLLFAAQCQPQLLVVDDYLALTEVRQACEQFLKTQGDAWLPPLVIDDGHNGLALISRNPLTHSRNGS